MTPKWPNDWQIFYGLSFLPSSSSSSSSVLWYGETISHMCIHGMHVWIWCWPLHFRCVVHLYGHPFHLKFTTMISIMDIIMILVAISVENNWSVFFLVCVCVSVCLLLLLLHIIKGIIIYTWLKWHHFLHSSVSWFYDFHRFVTLPLFFAVFSPHLFFIRSRSFSPVRSALIAVCSFSIFPHAWLMLQAEIVLSFAISKCNEFAMNIYGFGQKYNTTPPPPPFPAIRSPISVLPHLEFRQRKKFGYPGEWMCFATCRMNTCGSQVVRQN